MAKQSLIFYVNRSVTQFHAFWVKSDTFCIKKLKRKTEIWLFHKIMLFLPQGL